MSCYICGLTCANFIPSISFAPDWKPSWPVQHEREEQSDLPSPVLLLPATCLHTQLQLAQGSTADGLVWYDTLFQNVLGCFGYVWNCLDDLCTHQFPRVWATARWRGGAQWSWTTVLSRDCPKQQAMPLDFRGVGSGGGCEPAEIWFWNVLEIFRMF